MPAVSPVSSTGEVQRVNSAPSSEHCIRTRGSGSLEENANVAEVLSVVAGGASSKTAPSPTVHSHSS